MSITLSDIQLGSIVYLSASIETPPDQLLMIAKNIEEHYVRFPLKKGKGRKRWIDAPKTRLKAIQKTILHTLLYDNMPHNAAHGFVPKRSIVSNAQPHVGKKWVANYDIKDFFPSIKYEAVYETLSSYPTLNREEIFLLATLLTKDGQLPQGAPSSPHLANLAMREIDIQLSEYANRRQLTYTRYADDLSFSGDAIPLNMQRFIAKTIGKKGYRLAHQKSKVLGRHKRQLVTGLVVNDKLNLPRPVRKRLRAVIHDIKLRGFAAAIERSDLNLDQLFGRISLQAMWDKEQAESQIEALAAALNISD